MAVFFTSVPHRQKMDSALTPDAPVRQGKTNAGNELQTG
ncbi:MAG: hypothetical protein H6Q99_2787 [Proteobacteria bacterium]|nr:hypothetical protein [Pseudomonadota bacterium]